MGDLKVVGVLALSLFFTRCECGELTVHGFWHQLGACVDRERKTAVTELRCDGCGAVRLKRFRLTTGRGTRHRLVRWDRVFWATLPYLPNRWVRRAAALTLWLEKWFPI